MAKTLGEQAEHEAEKLADATLEEPETADQRDAAVAVAGEICRPALRAPDLPRRRAPRRPRPEAPRRNAGKGRCDRRPAERGRAVRSILKIALGIIAAIGGFLDIGDLVFTTQAGALFRYDLLWAVVLGVVGIAVYAEMCGRVAAVSGRPVFDVIRMRMGFGIGLLALVASTARQPAHRRRRARRDRDRPRAPLRRPLTACSSSLAAIALVAIVALLPFGGIERVFGYGGLLLLRRRRHRRPPEPRLGRCRPRLHPLARLLDALPLLRRRHLRRGADALRGPLLFLRRDRGEVERAEPEREPAQRDRRLRDRRRPRGRAGRSSPATSSTRSGSNRTTSAPWRCRCRAPSARPACCWRSAACSSASAEPRSTPASPPPTTSPSSSAGSGAATEARGRHRASPPPGSSSSCSGSRSPRAGSTRSTITEYSVVLSVVALPLTYLPVLLIAGDRSFMGEHANGRVATTLGWLYFAVIVVLALGGDPAAAGDQRGGRMKGEGEIYVVHRLLDEQICDCRRPPRAAGSTTSS